MTETPAWSHGEATTGTGAADSGCRSRQRTAEVPRDGAGGTWGGHPGVMLQPWGYAGDAGC